MKDIFSSIVDFNADVYRNIPALRRSIDFFDDIDDQKEDISNIANIVENLPKSDILPGMIAEDFHYSTSISYPFSTEPFMKTRYSDGTYGVWYGSIEMNTTIAETAYHMINRESQIEGHNETTIIQERALYKVKCKAVLIDLSKKARHYPDLISNDYSLTQQIGKRLQLEGHPGLLAPSARCYGTNTVIFNQNVLYNPRNNCYLTYKLLPVGELIVERTPGKTLIKFPKNHFFKKKEQLPEFI